MAATASAQFQAGRGERPGRHDGFTSAEPSRGQSLSATVDALRQAIRDSSVGSAQRDELLDDFVQGLVDKYLRSPGAVPIEEAFKAVTLLSSFATQYPQAFGYGDPKRVGHVVLGLLEQLPAAAQPAHATALLHALRSVLLLLRTSDARAFATLAAEVVDLLAHTQPGADASIRPCFLQFAALCTKRSPREGCGSPADARQRAAPAMLRLAGPQHSSLWLGLLQLAAAMHADAPQFLGDGGPTLWSALSDALELASIGFTEALRPLRALETILQEHLAPLAVRHQLVHVLLSILCLRLPAVCETSQILQGWAIPQASGNSSCRARSSKTSAMSDLWNYALKKGECDELIGNCLLRVISPEQPPLPSLNLLLRSTPWILAFSSGVTLHVALCRLWCTLPRAVLAKHVLLLEEFLGLEATGPLVVPCFQLAVLPGVDEPIRPVDAPNFLVGDSNGIPSFVQAVRMRNDVSASDIDAMMDSPASAPQRASPPEATGGHRTKRRRRVSPGGSCNSVDDDRDAHVAAHLDCEISMYDPGLTVRARLLELAEQLEFERGGQAAADVVPQFRKLCAICRVLLRVRTVSAVGMAARERICFLLADALEWLHGRVIRSAPGGDSSAKDGEVADTGIGTHIADCGAGHGRDESDRVGRAASSSGGSNINSVPGRGPGHDSSRMQIEWREGAELLGVALGLIRDLAEHGIDGGSLVFTLENTESPTVIQQSIDGARRRMIRDVVVTEARSRRHSIVDHGGLCTGPDSALVRVGEEHEATATLLSLLPASLRVKALNLAALPWNRGGSSGECDDADEVEAGVHPERPKPGDEIAASANASMETPSSLDAEQKARRRWTLCFDPSLRCEALAVLMRVRAQLPAEHRAEGAALCARCVRANLVDASYRASLRPAIDDGGGAGEESLPTGEARVLCAALGALPSLAQAIGLAPLRGCVEAMLTLLRQLRTSGGAERPHAAAALADSLGKLACVHDGCCQTGVQGLLGCFRGDGIDPTSPRCWVCDCGGSHPGMVDTYGDGRAAVTSTCQHVHHSSLPVDAPEIGRAMDASGDCQHTRESSHCAGGIEVRRGGRQRVGASRQHISRRALNARVGAFDDADKAEETPGRLSKDLQAEKRVGEQLYGSFPLLWSLLCALPQADARVRSALVYCIGRLGRHASPTLIWQHVEVVQAVVGLLADPSIEVSSACAVVLPRLLGCATFVRVVGLRQQPPSTSKITQAQLGNVDEADMAVEETAASQVNRASRSRMGKEAGPGGASDAHGKGDDEIADECAWERPLAGQILHDVVLGPMIAMLRGESDADTISAPHFKLSLMSALGALGRQGLYSEPVCRSAIVLALCTHIGCDERSREYGTAMRELRALAAAHAAEVDADNAETNTCASLAAGTTEALCRALLPQLGREWVWWLVERPDLLLSVAQRLLDANITEMVRILLPHALPEVVLLGGLARKAVYPQGDRGNESMNVLSMLSEHLGQVHAMACPCRVSCVELSPFHAEGENDAQPTFTNSKAIREGAWCCLKTPCSMSNLCLQCQSLPSFSKICLAFVSQTKAEILIDHMHLLLAELFVQQASDDTGQLNDAILGGLELVASCGVPPHSLSDLIQMCAEELLHEMILRLGRASGTAETQVVLLALNLLIPVGLQVGSLDDNASCSALGGASVCGSAGLVGTNASLRAYIDANFHMIVQFLRDQLAARSRTTADKRVALNALGEVLTIMEGEEVSQSWWGEIVATIKLVLQQPPLQVQALNVLAKFVRLLDPEVLARGLTPLFLMVLPCLAEHASVVVPILEDLVVVPHEAGNVSDSLAAALSELAFVPAHPALARLRSILATHYTPKESLRQRLNGCLRGLQHESGAVRLMALGQLREELSNARRPELASLLGSDAPIDLELLSAILHALLGSLRHSSSVYTSGLTRHSQTSDAVLLSCHCLGELGAIDPWRLSQALNSSLPSDSRQSFEPTLGPSSTTAVSNTRSATIFTVDISDEQLTARLAEDFLVVALRDASEGQIVQASAYALGVLLRRVCGCTAETPQRFTEWYDANARSERQGPRASAWRSLPPEDRRPFETWASLSDETRRAAKPYLVLSAEARGGVAAREPERSPIFVSTIRYAEWLRRWSRQLLAYIAKLRESLLSVDPQLSGDGQMVRRKCARRAELLLACEPCLRFEPQLALVLLPYMILLLLHISGIVTSSPASLSDCGLARSVEKEIICEMTCVLSHNAPAAFTSDPPAGGTSERVAIAYGVTGEHPLCCHALFTVLDVLHEWLSQCRPREVGAIHQRLEVFIRSLPAMQIARCALGVGATHRALLVMERHVDLVQPAVAGHFLHPKSDRRMLPVDAAALVARAYSQTEEPDGLLGLSRMRDATSIEEERLQNEINGRFDAALGGYQIELQRPAGMDVFPETRSARIEAQLGLCRCLRLLGLSSQMKHAAEGAMREWASEAERFQLRACAAGAAWRLGEWDEVRRLASPDDASLVSQESDSYSCAEAIYDMEIARALLALTSSTSPEAVVRSHCDNARAALVPLLAATSAESYAHAYPHLVRLQVAHDLQAAAPLLCVPSSSNLVRVDSHDSVVELFDFWEVRLSAMSASLQAQEPVLALHLSVRHEMLARAMASSGAMRGGVESHEGNDIDDGPSSSVRGLKRGLGQAWLRLAKSARSAGNLQSESSALLQARLYDPTRATLASAKMEWAAGHSHDAMARLRQQRARLEASLPDRPSAEEREALGATILMLARFSCEAGELETDEVLAMHNKVTELCPNWEKGHYWLGRFHDGQLRDALEAATRREVEVPGTQPGQMSCPSKRVVPPKERERKKVEAHATYLAPMIRCYGVALHRGAKHAPSVMPRMLTLWLDYADKLSQAEAGDLGSLGNLDKAERLRQPHEAMSKVVAMLPLRIWLPCVPQLVSRTCHRDDQTRKLLLGLLAQLLAEYPQQLVWAVIPVALSTNPERKRPGEQIVAQAKQHLLRKPGLEVLRAGASLIAQLRKVCNDEAIDKGIKRVSMKSRFPQLYKLTGLPLVIPIYANLTATEPTGGAGVSVSPFSDDAPRIELWEDNVDVMGSLQRPKKVIIRGSDGQLYPFLCKPKDDLRKDARMMEFMTAVNRLLRRSPNCRRRRLSVQCYAVTPIDQECGLIEWVPNMVQLRGIIKGYWESLKLPFSHNDVKTRHAAVMALPPHRRRVELANLLQAFMTELPPVLHLWLMDQFGDPSRWFEARLAFTRSCAVMSMIGFAVGLGDRHLENILVNSGSGSLMHVDFACLFDHGLNLATPEQVPFRLTQNLVHAMGMSGVEGAFQRVSELTLEQLRNHREALLNVLSTMRHDPLVEWKKRNQREDTSGRLDSEEADKELGKIDKKLKGILPTHGNTPLSVQGQVQHLINDATNVYNLSQMYIWWMPWC